MKCLSGKLARVAIIAVLACAATALLADHGIAASKALNGRYSASELKDKCDANGGTFDGHGSNGGYSCAGSGGTVQCNNKGFCVGTCNKCAALAKGLNGILRPPASAGTTSTGGGTANNKRPLHNVNQPIVVQHSGGARSGGSKH